MSGLIKVIPQEDRFNMALYYAGQPVQVLASGDPARLSRGRQIYASQCRSCHGEQGLGSEKHARLAGQQPVYLKQTLEQYRKGDQQRSDRVMSSAARKLKDDDIAALVACLPTMK